MADIHGDNPKENSDNCLKFPPVMAFANIIESEAPPIKKTFEMSTYGITNLFPKK